MRWKSRIILPYALWVSKKINRDANNAIDHQNQILLKNIAFAKNTQFGRDHSFEKIKSHEDFKQLVPLRSYDQLRPYIVQITQGKKNILWPDQPKYIVGTAGTTGGIKHIPLSNECMPFHLKTAIHAGMNFAHQNEFLDMFDGKLMFLSGTPELDKIGGILTGRLSGIVNHEIPSWLRKSQSPTFKTNCIKDWNQKIEAIVKETHGLDLRMISGIPPWILMYLEKLLEYTQKTTVKEVFPNLRMIMHGGVNYKPYSPIFKKLVGENVHFVETYPTTEGFIAFQDRGPEDGLLLNTNGGIFFEFVPIEEIYQKQPTRLSLGQVETEKEYAIIINNNAGLWGSIIGDIVKFKSINPFRLTITGRTSQFISAFGEHIVASDVDEVMSRTIQKTGGIIKEFTVAPFISQSKKQHQWYIEFDELPPDLSLFKKTLDKEMQDQNFHYKDLVQGKVISSLEVVALPKGSFVNYLAKEGKLGGQNKIPRLSNNMSIAEKLQASR